MNIGSNTGPDCPDQCPVCRKAIDVGRSSSGLCPTCGQLLGWIRKQLPEQTGAAPDRLTPDTRFNEDLHADSMDVVELILEIEEEFGVVIPDEEVPNLKTVGDTIRFIENHGGVVTVTP